MDTWLSYIPYPSCSNSKLSLPTPEEKAANQLVGWRSHFLTRCPSVPLEAPGHTGQPPWRCCICPCPFYSRGQPVWPPSPGQQLCRAARNRCEDVGRGGEGAACSWPLSLSRYQRGSLPWLPVRACALLALSLSKWFNFFIPSLIFYCFLWMKREKLVLKNI